jgi:hypothetical protein
MFGGGWLGHVCGEEKKMVRWESIFQETGFIDFYGPDSPKVDDRIV